MFRYFRVILSPFLGLAMISNCLAETLFFEKYPVITSKMVSEWAHIGDASWSKASNVGRQDLFSPKWKRISDSDLATFSQQDKNIFDQIQYLEITLREAHSRKYSPEAMTDYYEESLLVAQSELLKHVIWEELYMTRVMYAMPEIYSSEAKRLGLSTKIYASLAYVMMFDRNARSANETIEKYTRYSSPEVKLDIRSSMLDLEIISNSSDYDLDEAKLAYWRAIFSGKTEQKAMQAESNSILKDMQEELRRTKNELRELKDDRNNNRRNY